MMQHRGAHRRPHFFHVSCPQCRQRIREAPRDAAGFPDPAQRYDVGSYADPIEGCAHFYTPGGRIPLCWAKEKAR
jgi:hypothetical protein